MGWRCVWITGSRKSLWKQRSFLLFPTYPFLSLFSHLWTILNSDAFHLRHSSPQTFIHVRFLANMSNVPCEIMFSHPFVLPSVSCQVRESSVHRKGPGKERREGSTCFGQRCMVVASHREFPLQGTSRPSGWEGGWEATVGPFLWPRYACLQTQASPSTPSPDLCGEPAPLSMKWEWQSLQEMPSSLVGLFA